MSFKLTTGSTVYSGASATITSSTNTTATIKVTASGYFNSGWVYSTGVKVVITINGSSTTKTLLGVNNYYYASDGTKTVDYSVTVNKSTASQSIAWSVKFYQYTDTVNEGLKETKTGSVSVAAKPSYAITYNANGGTGAPAKQTKWYGTALTLSSTKPTRTGYSFQGWGTSASATTVAYKAGASYTANAAATFYAIWKADTYAISYDANGGTGAPSNQTKTYGVDLTLSSTIPTRANYNFLGWGTSASATTVAYAAGATYTANSAATLYAVWELAYWKPRISNLTATRCDSDGTANEYGAYANIEFNWELCQLIGTNTEATIDIDWGNDVTTVVQNGTSGSVSQVIGDGTFSVEASYQFVVKVTDNSDSTQLYITIPAAAFPIDVKAGGTGVTFGAPATEDGFNCMMPANFNAESIFGASAHFAGGLTEDIPVYGTCDCDDLVVSGNYYIGISGLNRPENYNGWLTVKSYSNGDYCYQYYASYRGNRYYRFRQAGVWGEWIPEFVTGTWTATINGGAVSAQHCTYVKTGNMCTISFEIEGTGASSATTSATSGKYLYITGAPFAPSTGARWFGGGGHTQGLGIPSGQHFTGFIIQSSDSFIYARTSTANVTGDPGYCFITNGAKAFYLSGSITYPVA